MSDLTDLPLRLREALERARFTYDGVAELLGPLAHAALGRNETVPGLRRTRGGSPLETLVRLFLLQAPVSHEQAEAALPGLVDKLAVEGILAQSVGEVAARLTRGETDPPLLADAVHLRRPEVAVRPGQGPGGGLAPGKDKPRMAPVDEVA